MSYPIWTPKHPEQSRMWQFMQSLAKTQKTAFDSYPAFYQWSVDNPALFWDSLRQFFNLRFHREASQVLSNDQEMMNARWFEGALLNVAEQYLHRRDDHPALVCLNENQEKQVISYKELYALVAQCAAGLKQLGVVAGDRVAAVLPNSAFAVIGMLASASIGAIWSSCSPDFGAAAALDRLGQIEPKVLFICDGHQYQGKQYPANEKIMELAQSMTSLKQIVICPTIRTNIDLQALPEAVYWDAFLQPAEACDFIPLPFAHPLYILFSSGTTGKPKCIVHSAGGALLQHMKELALHSDIGPADNLCFYTTCGWMMWNWSVSALALGATLTLYEGSPTYPEADSLFRVVANEKITVFGTSAKYLSAIEKEGVKPKDVCDLGSLRCILSTGSPLLPKSYDYVYEQIKHDLQLSSISGGTDIVSCFALGNPILPVYKGELQCRGLGMAVAIFNDKGQAVQEERGELVCTKAFPAMPVGFWNDTDRQAYKKAYFERFPGVWAHGDFAELTEHEGLIIYGRSDAVLNPGGVRIGTAEIYKLVQQFDSVVDSVVIGQPWEDDLRVVLFLQLRPGLILDEALEQSIRQHIRQHASPRHVPAKILQVQDIPRTMSGKTVELAVKQVVCGEEVHNLKSLANPEALEYFKNRCEL